MKKIIVLVVLFSPAFLLADDRAVFLKQGFGAKALGLGKAYGSTVKDPSALFWNPAGLANIDGSVKSIKKINPGIEAENAFEDPEFTDLETDTTESKKNNQKENQPVETLEKTFEMQIYSAISQMSLDRQMGFVGVGATLPYGTLGVGALGTQVTGIDGYDASGNSTGAAEYRAFAGYLGYGFTTKSDLKIGASLMGLQEDIGGSSINGGGLNVGIQKSVFLLLLAEIGVDVQNLAGVIQRNSAQTDKVEKLDTIVRASLALSPPPPNANAKLLLGFSVNVDDPDNGLSGSVGLAVTLNRFSYVMVGLANSQLSAGIGLQFRYIDLAYTINRDPLSIGYQHFGEVNIKI